MKSLTTLLMLVAFLVCCSRANYDIGQRSQEVLRESTSVLSAALNDVSHVLHYGS